jgi:hypothetical protein
MLLGKEYFLELKIIYSFRYHLLQWENHVVGCMVVVGGFFVLFDDRELFISGFLVKRT